MEQKTLLLTGAAGGMGQAVSALFKRNGWTVIGLDRKEADDVMAADLTDNTAVERARDNIAAEHPKLDAIVHLAGRYEADSLIEMEEKDFVGIFDTNLFSIYRVNKAFADMLCKDGRIVMVSSELAPLDPLPFTGIYALTKSAIEKYAFSLRMEVQLLEIKVSVIRPGAVSTGMLEASKNAIRGFQEKTEHYKANASRFLGITEKVESRCVKAEKLAKKAFKAATARRPKYIYKLNRNPLLLILNALPDRFQTWVLGKIIEK